MGVSSMYCLLEIVSGFPRSCCAAGPPGVCPSPLEDVRLMSVVILGRHSANLEHYPGCFRVHTGKWDCRAWVLLLSLLLPWQPYHCVLLIIINDARPLLGAVCAPVVTFGEVSVQSLGQCSGQAFAELQGSFVHCGHRPIIR